MWTTVHIAIGWHQDYAAKRGVPQLPTSEQVSCNGGSERI